MKNMALWVFFLIAFISCTQNNEREQDTSKKYDSTNVEIVANDFSITQKDSVFPSSSQIEIFDERLNYDTISLKKISINGIYLGDSAKKVIKVLGKPDSVVNTKNEMGGYEYISYWYSKSHFSIHNGVVEGFDIVDKKYSFDNIKVGNDVKVFSKKYPKSYKNQVVSEDKFVIKLFITSANKGDYYCPDLIDFSIKNGRIESFNTWTAW